MSTVSDPFLRVSRRCRAVQEIPFWVEYGDWCLSPWPEASEQRQHAEVHPQHAPWNSLFAELDTVGIGLSSEPVDLLDEVDAIIASCWRFGSYFHLLTFGELFPAFKEDSSLSRVTDSEMKRINLEFSSGLAAWWSTRESDPQRANRRTRAALEALPMDWKRKRPKLLAEVVSEFPGSCAEQIAKATATLPPINMLDQDASRIEANYAVQFAYRNGPIEDYHAGKRSHGTVVPGYSRFYPAELNRLANHMAKHLGIYLGLREGVGAAGVAAMAQAQLDYPRNWSVVAETSPVSFPNITGYDSKWNTLRHRFRWLWERYPDHYFFCQEHPGGVVPGDYGVVRNRETKSLMYYDNDSDSPDTAVIYAGTPFKSGPVEVDFEDLEPANRNESIQYEMEHLAELPPDLRDRLGIHPKMPSTPDET